MKQARSLVGPLLLFSSFCSSCYQSARCLSPQTLAQSLTADKAIQPTPMQSSGHLHVDIATGRLDGTVCVSDRKLGFDKAFSLNAGLNVARVTDADNKNIDFEGWYAPGVDGEARVYRLSTTSPSMCVTYVGSLPVYPMHDAPDDFKGLIAFNGDSIRASEQAAWLPTPFNLDTKVREGDTAYDLTVNCDGCRFLYMNGSSPKEQSAAKFQDSIPRVPLFFGGTGPVTRTKSVTVLNETVAPEQIDALSALFLKIEAFYRQYMGQEVTDQPTLLRMVTLNQVDRDKRGGSWGFASWPTIALSGSINQLGAEIIKPTSKSDYIVPYLAHETAHYYFGTVLRPKGPYYWFLLESTAEFLSFKALQSISGQVAATRRVEQWSSELKNDKSSLVAFNKVQNMDDITGTYRYNYGPLLLLSLERQVGEAKMRTFMRELLSTAQIQHWDDIKSAALRAGVSEAEWESWSHRCVDNSPSSCVVSITPAPISSVK